MTNMKKNNQGARILPDMKRGMESLYLVLVKLFVGILVIDENHGACRKSLRNRLRISFMPERYSSGVNTVC
jgi:hypothetical protein